MFKITLNSRKPYNYAFFCPVSKLHLTVSNPVGFVHEVTPAISRGLKNGTLAMAEIDNSDDKTKETEYEPSPNFQESPTAPSGNTEISSGSGANTQPSSTSTENTGKKKRGRRAAIATPTEDVPNDLFKDIQ